MQSNKQQQHNSESDYPSNKQISIVLSVFFTIMFIYFLFDANIL